MKYFTSKQIEELAKQIERDDLPTRVFKRTQVVYLRAIGKSVPAVMEISGYSRTGIQKLCAAYRARGVSALDDNYAGSQYRKLTFQKEAEVLAQILGDATAGKLVRASDLKKQFEGITGVTYNIYPFYRLLQRHEWRKVKPRGQHPKAASEEAIEASKKLT